MTFYSHSVRILFKWLNPTEIYSLKDNLEMLAKDKYEIR